VAGGRHSPSTICPSSTKGGILYPGSAAAALCCAAEPESEINYPKSSAASCSCSDASASAAPSPRSAGCALSSPRTAGRLLPAYGRCSCRYQNACAARPSRGASEAKTRVVVSRKLLSDQRPGCIGGPVPAKKPALASGKGLEPNFSDADHGAGSPQVALLPTRLAGMIPSRDKRGMP
jgi:hypothetical protein